MLVQAEYRRQMTVHCCRGTPALPPIEHHDVVSWRWQPGHEPGDIIDPDIAPVPPGAAQELEPQLRTGRVRPLGVGRPLQRSQLSQVGLDRPDHATVIGEDRPRDRTGNGITTRFTNIRSYLFGPVVGYVKSLTGQRLRECVTDEPFTARPLHRRHCNSYLI